MTQRSNSVRTSQIVADDRVKDAVQRLLYSAVHVEKRFTAGQIATESGVSKGSIDAYLSIRPEAQRQPSLAAALSIAVVLGERAVNSILALIGYGGAHPLDEPHKPNLATITAHLISGVSVIANAAADLQIDHHEEEPVREAADMIIAEVLPFSSSARAS